MEAGAEAIMPLSRNSQGELGVKVAQQQSLNNLKIEIKNESGQNLEVANTTVGQDMEGMVIGIVLKGLKNNKMGLRDAVGR